jgi:hypothetical protein
MAKERIKSMSTVNDERRQLSPSKAIWNGTIDRFEVLSINIEGHYGQIGAGSLYDSRYVDFLNEVPHTSQI